MSTATPHPRRARPRGVTIGVDIGQRVDPTAIAVVETEDRAPAPAPERLIVHGHGGATVTERQPAVRPAPDYHFVVRHLERLALGTPYPAVADRVVTVVRGVAERTGRTPRLFIDATGVGAPVVDALKAGGVTAQMWACFFTFGDKRTTGAGTVTIGKAWLVSRVQVLLQRERLHLPRTSESEALAKELLDYEIKVDPDGDAKFGAFRVGTHDDLVTALGLGVQAEPKLLRFY